MDVVKRAALILIGVAMVFAAAWLMSKGVATEEVAEIAAKLAELERRVDHVERRISNFAAPSYAGTPGEVDQMSEHIARLQEQISSLSPSSTSPDGPASPGQRAREHTGMSPSGIHVGPQSPEASLEAGQLERLVTEVVASLTPGYVEEQVSQLYAAQKKADEEARQEAEQRRAQELRERRLAQLVTDLHAFVHGLTPFQVEEVARVIGEQWEEMAAMRQQARENGTLTAPGEILQRAREMTDEKLYAIFSAPQLEAFRLWRETRFGAPEGIPR
jgi:cell division protein FtsB